MAQSLNSLDTPHLRKRNKKRMKKKRKKRKRKSQKRRDRRRNQKSTYIIMTSKAQQIKLDNALVAPENLRVIGKCNMKINPRMKPEEPAYQVVLDALALTTCYLAFLITAKVPVIYMH
nr:hypothetical protein [Tanacetum cinerariifolium]